MTTSTPNIPYPSPYYQRQSAGASLRGCIWCLFLLFILIALISIIVALLVVFVFKPKKPQFNLQQVSVHYLVLVPNNAPTYLSLNITMVFTAVNPNKVGIQYSPCNFWVLYEGAPLGVAHLPGFYQPAHSSRMVGVGVNVDRLVLNFVNAPDLVRDAIVNDRVVLKIIGTVGGKIRVLGISSPEVKVGVKCFIAISPMKRALTSQQCGVDGVSI